MPHGPNGMTERSLYLLRAGSIPACGTVFGGFTIRPHATESTNTTCPVNGEPDIPYRLVTDSYCPKKLSMLS